MPQAKKGLNGTECTPGDWDHVAERWEFNSGGTAMGVRRDRVECIMCASKKALAHRCFQPAEKYHHYGTMASDYVLNRLYEQLADTPEGIKHPVRGND